MKNLPIKGPSRWEHRIGDWPSRDPIEEEGGVNLYQMLANAPVNHFDPFGTLMFRVEKTQYRKDLGVSPTSAIPTDTPMIDRDDVIGLTTMEWTIKSRCKCANDGKFYLFSTIVRMHAVVHYRPSYPSKAEEAFVKHGEQDHVGDIKWWGRNEGKMVAQTQETKQERMPFDDKESCESAANAAMQDALRPSAGMEMILSKIHYDYPGGPHEWPPSRGK